MFTKISTAALLAAALSACQSPAPRVGNDADAHGCRASAGETFSQLRQRCVRVFDVADIRLPDPDNAALAAYALLSDDRQTGGVILGEVAAVGVVGCGKRGICVQGWGSSVDLSGG